MTNNRQPLILLTGATGYVGGRLLRRLQEDGCRVRCLARRPEYLQARANEHTEIVGGDVLQADTLADVCEGVDVAYYLIHSMGSKKSFVEQDRIAAANFGAAARAAGVRRIVYLGGLGESDAKLSPHLASRHETGRVLRESGVEIIELRASIVIGSGSLSFELIRSLVEKLPVMIAPRWVRVEAQPIAINDLLEYLLQARDVTAEGNPVFEIGGKDVVTYQDLMEEYARQRGLTRHILPVPLLTPWLSSLWLGLVTPVFARIGRKLIDSLRHPTTVQDDSAYRVFGIETKGLAAAIEEAIRYEDREFSETSWSDALAAGGSLRQWGGLQLGSRLIDHRTKHTTVSVACAFDSIRCIGGERGWYCANWLWRLRGFIDLLAGGVGMRRGRRHPVDLRVGDVIDWWRVEKIDDNKSLTLYAEMKLPGRAWLQFDVTEDGGGTVIHQTAIFEPLGLWGRLYWYGVYPLHVLIFSGMLRGVVKASRKDA